MTATTIAILHNMRFFHGCSFLFTLNSYSFPWEATCLILWRLAVDCGEIFEGSAAEKANLPGSRFADPAGFAEAAATDAAAEAGYEAFETAELQTLLNSFTSRRRPSIRPKPPCRGCR